FSGVERFQLKLAGKKQKRGLQRVGKSEAAELQEQRTSRASGVLKRGSWEVAECPTRRVGKRWATVWRRGSNTQRVTRPNPFHFAQLAVSDVWFAGTVLQLRHTRPLLMERSAAQKKCPYCPGLAGRGWKIRGVLQ